MISHMIYDNIYLIIGKLEELQQMFPQTKESVLNSAITVALGNVGEAVDVILSGKGTVCTFC